MIFTVLFIAFLAQLFLVPMLCYKKSGKRMQRFYSLMLMTYHGRFLYKRIALLLLLAFHCLYIYMPHGTIVIYDMLPTSVLTLCMFNHNYTERILHFLQNKRTFFLTALLAMASAFTPHFMPTSVCLALLMECALFYPSRYALDQPMTTDFVARCHTEARFLTNVYYHWD